MTGCVCLGLGQSFIQPTNPKGLKPQAGCYELWVPFGQSKSIASLEAGMQRNGNL